MLWKQIMLALHCLKISPFLMVAKEWQIKTKITFYYIRNLTDNHGIESQFEEYIE